MDADLASDAGRLELGDPAPANLRKCIPYCHDDARNTRANQRLRTRRCFALMATRFQRNVHGGTSRPLSGRRERIHFRMRTTEMLMPAFAHDLATLNDHAANHRIWLDRALPARGERQRMRHVADVVVVAACQFCRTGFSLSALELSD